MERKELLIKSCLVCLTLMITTIFSTSPQQAWAKSKVKPIELSFAMIIPPMAPAYSKNFKPFVEEIEKRSNGRVKIKMYPSGSLLKVPEMNDGIIKGIADMGFTSHNASPGRYPLASVFELPFLIPSSHVGSRVLTDLYKKFPEMRAEYKDFHVLYHFGSHPYQIHSAKKPVRKLEDIKGMKVGCEAGTVGAIKALGATPINAPPLQHYTSLDKGTLDALCTAWGFVNAFKICEVTKYHTNINMAVMSLMVIMNNKTWNKLPKDIQKIFTDVAGEMQPDTHHSATMFSNNMGVKTCKKGGNEIIEVSPEERERWKAACKPIWDKWVKKMEAKGLPGRAVLDEAVKLVKKYEKR